MPTNYITLTRQELYDMVWSEPMSSLEPSAVAQSTLPIPYRGYGARKATGQVPPQTSLPKYRTRPCSDDRAIATAPAPPSGAANDIASLRFIECRRGDRRRH